MLIKSFKRFLEDEKLCQIILMSISFMMIFTAFNTTSSTAQIVLDSVKKIDPSFNGNGYTSLCIIYATFGLSTWIAPSVLAILKTKLSLCFASIFYVLFIIGFIYPMNWFFYLSSVLLGAAAALLWTANGTFITLNSNDSIITRNSGVFWAINQCSLFFGNAFVFWQFEGKKEIDQETRIFVFAFLAAVGICGIVGLCFLKNKDDKKKYEVKESSESEVEKNKDQGALELASKALKEAVKLSVTPNMLLLSLTSIYSGLESCFWGGVYANAIGFTEKFGGDSKKLVGLVMIVIGIGEVLGGSIFGLFGTKTTKNGKSPIVFLGMFAHITAFVLIYLNLADDSPFGPTHGVSYFDPPLLSVALIAAFLIGFGDACFITQIISALATIFSDKSSAAFALFRFTQSFASAGAFFYSLQLGILLQMIILISTCVVGSLAFFIVERRTAKGKEDCQQN